MIVLRQEKINKNDMELLLKRIARKPTYTIGKLYVNKVYVCGVLEDYDRIYFGGSKVAGKTAIPCGRYEVVLNNYSPKFGNKEPYKSLCGGCVPLIANVPNFSGVRIHCGNYAGFETFYKKVSIPKEKDILQTEEYIEVL